MHPKPGDSLPDDDHVARSCGDRSWDIDNSGNAVVQSTAFELKPKDKGKLSVNWLEHLEQNNRALQLSKLRSVFINKGMSLRKKGIFAILNNRQTKARVFSVTGKYLEFLYDRQPDDDSHSLILGIPHEESPEALTVQELIADTVIETYPERG